MKAWRIHGVNDLKIDELASLPVSEGCVKLKNLCSAVSLTDCLIYDGKLNSDRLPLIPGRHGIGMVTETGEGVTKFVRGDRVAIEPYIYCGSCANCKASHQGECEKLLTYGVDEDGFLRDFAVVSANGIYKIPERIKDSEAIFLEYTAMALNTFNKLGLEKGEHIVIVGANITGIILAQIALYYQTVPIVVDSRQDRLNIAESLGVYYALNCVDTDVQKKIFSLTGGRMAEAVAHIASAQLPLSKSLDYAARGGKVALTGWGVLTDGLNINMNNALSRQLTIICVNNGARQTQSAINLLVNKTVNVTPLISKEVPFSETKAVLDEFKEFPDKYIKVIIKM